MLLGYRLAWIDQSRTLAANSRWGTQHSRKGCDRVICLMQSMNSRGVYNIRKSKKCSNRVVCTSAYVQHACMCIHYACLRVVLQMKVDFRPYVRKKSTNLVLLKTWTCTKCFQKHSQCSKHENISYVPDGETKYSVLVH